jgi:phosphatidate phosphatase APP1
MIMPYIGIGNEKEVYLLGRVLRNRDVGPATIEDSRFWNFRKMYKRFMTWKIPNVRIAASFEGKNWTTLTDEEGYFEFQIKDHSFPKTEHSWRQFQLELLDKVLPHQGEVKSEANIFIPTKLVEYGIISDVDDTIVSTGATKFWEMIKTTFLGNAYSRIPFPGVAAFYQALAKGTDGKENNPLFYVSSSPWNLYDFLLELLMVHQIPKGPLMLRDLGLSREQFIAGSHFDHKLNQVEKIFRLVPDIPFILIGDSGQYDPEIYLEVIKDFPERVKRIYIRHVAEKRKEEVLQIQATMLQLGVQMLLVTDTVEAAEDALAQGWIREIDVQQIIEENITAQ